MLIDALIYMSDPKYDSDLGNDGEILQGDGDTTLVIRKSLLTLIGDLKKDWWCHNIFHSMRIVKEKVYSLIIDNVSCQNIVFAEAMKKLKMIIENHFKQYKIGIAK